MKKFLFGALAALVMLGAFSFKITYDLKNSSAEVEQIEGYYIFVDSKPIKEYEYLGTVKTPSVRIGDSQYTGVRDVLIKRAKKDFPKADALIFTFKTGSADKCEAIKFKN